MADAAAFPDRDLDSIREARELARRARAAQTRLANLSQEQIDAIVDAVAAAAQGEVEAFARLAVDEFCSSTCDARAGFHFQSALYKQRLAALVSISRVVRGHFQ